MAGLVRERPDSAGPSRASKKPRVQETAAQDVDQVVGPDGHQVGSIVRVTVHDFLTYTDAEFRPGPRINLVVGPNGTGKSSVVCAIALGLGCKIKTLGRAEQEVAYIRQGCDMGWDEIELQSPPGKPNVVIRMTITKDPLGGGSTSWKLNGKTVNKKEILRTVNALHINMDSLLQLLPQDRVHEFSGLAPPELLRQTEEAVDADGLRRQHDELISIEKEQFELTQSLAEKEERLETLQKAQEALKRDKLRFEKRQRHIARAAELKLKRPWLEFEQQQQKTKSLKERLAKSQQDLTRLEENTAPMTKAVKAAQAQVTKVQEQHKKVRTESGNIEKQYMKLRSRLETLNDDVSEKRQEVQAVEARRQRLQADLENQQANLRENEEALATLLAKKETKLSAKNAEALAEVRKEIKELKRLITQGDLEHRRLDQSIKVKKSERQGLVDQRKSFASERNRIMSELSRNDPTARGVYAWVETNRNKLQDGENCLSPLALHVRPLKKEYAPFIENQAGQWAFRTILTSNKEDFRRLASEVQDKKKSSIPIIEVDVKAKRDITRQLTPAQMKKHHILCWLDEAFDSPDIVKQFFNARMMFSKIAIGREGKTNVEALFRESEVNGVYLIPGTIYTRSRSRHHSEVITSRQTIKPARLFASAEVADRETELESKIAVLDDELQQLEADLKKMNKDRDPLIRKDYQLKVKLRALEETAQKRAKYESGIRMAQQAIKDYQAQLERITTEAARAVLDKAISKLGCAYIEYLEIIDKAKEVNLELAVSAAAQVAAAAEYSIAKGNFDSIKTAIAVYRDQLKKDKRRYDVARALLKDLRAQAESEAPLNEELRALFTGMPDTLEELNAAIDDENVQADMIYNTDPTVLQRFKERQRELDDLEAAVAQERARVEENNNTVADKRNAWLTPLNELVGRINTSFARFMETMGCAGDVVLSNDDPNKYSSYGLEIMVKFREQSDMQRLMRSTQSGGEKSVSTMLFLLSLQEVTICPFRVVDEINQGMDAYNERKVFELATSDNASTSRSGMAPQYFIITPKLLTSLDYNENVTVFVVYNGEHNITQDQLEPETFVEHRLSQSQR